VTTMVNVGNVITAAPKRSWEDNGLVFPAQAGTPMNAKNLTARSFKLLLNKAGLPRTVRLHDLTASCNADEPSDTMSV